jgi:hypothetical protein
MGKLNSSTKFITLLISTIVIVAVWVTAVNAQVQLTENSKLALNGIGSIRVGMTVDEASQSAGIKLTRRVNSGLDEYECSYVEPKGEPKGISLMVTKGRIARVDIDSKRITTIKGARIGDSEDRIISLYPGQIQVTRHSKSKHLTFV